jgi:molybdopterin/thiamine biosynthesis adenylyltransferase
MALSREIIAATPALKRLHDDGFELAIKKAHLLVSSVPYVTAARTVARGTLIFPLTMATDMMAGKPPDHTAFFAGEKPHYADGTPINAIINREDTQKLADGIVSKFYFSSKPEAEDTDYEVKVRRYVDVLSTQARVLEPTASAQTRIIVESEDDDSPFVFLDTNSARAQIAPITDKLRGLKIAIVGLGGTGSYTLDLVSKTPVKEIHLFDDDEYSLHNAYRAPGTPTREQFRMLKVNYLAETYSRMHKGILPHPERVDETNLAKISGMDFVFLCMDPGPDKENLVNYLVNGGIPFIDTGLGVEAPADKLVGIVNTITVTPEYKTHVHKVPVKAGGDDDLYASNIQIAELNALNAVSAVIRWKKHFGFYDDNRREHESTYTIGPNMLTNEETRS